MVAAVLLWRTQVPELDAPPVAAADAFEAETLRRNARHETWLTLAWAAGVAAQLGALALLARRAPEVRGPRALRGAVLGAAAYATAWLAALPFALAAHAVRRDAEVARVGYLGFVTGAWGERLGELALAALAGALLVVVAARLGPRAWVGCWATVAAVAALWVALAPGFLAPRLRPLEDARLAAEIAALGRELGVGETRVQVRRARERTRAVNAEAVGAGPTTTVILWDTLLAATPGEIRFAAAHELAHVSRSHLWKGLGWFVLLALPGAWVLARAARLDDPRELPRVALVLVVLQLAALPVANAISRRYEAEADWVALRATRDAGGAEALYRRFASANLADPDPPRLLHLLLDTHPTLVSRVAASRAATGSP